MKEEYYVDEWGDVRRRTLFDKIQRFIPKNPPQINVFGNTPHQETSEMNVGIFNMPKGK